MHVFTVSNEPAVLEAASADGAVADVLEVAVMAALALDSHVVQAVGEGFAETRSLALVR